MVFRGKSQFRYMLVAFAAVGVMVAAVACGGGGSGNSSSNSGQTVQVSEKEWTITVAGTQMTKGNGDASVPTGTVTFNIKNDGTVDHQFEIQGNGIDKHTDNIAPGKTGKLTVNLTAGKYEVWCPIPGHKEAGMDGFVTAS